MEDVEELRCSEEKRKLMAFGLNFLGEVQGGVLSCGDGEGGNGVGRLRREEVRSSW